MYDGILSEFEELSADEQTRNMSGTSSEGMDQMIDYIYDHYDNFRLLLKCGDSGKFEDFIHNMVEREVEASQKYMKAMCDAGIEFPAVSKSLMHMIYTGFFSSVLQIIEDNISYRKHYTPYIGTSFLSCPLQYPTDSRLLLFFHANTLPYYNFAQAI